MRPSADFATPADPAGGPDAVIVAIIAPALVAGGVAMIVGAAISGAVSVWTRNFLAVVLVGVLSVGLMVTFISP